MLKTLKNYSIELKYLPVHVLFNLRHLYVEERSKNMFFIKEVGNTIYAQGVELAK